MAQNVLNEFDSRDECTLQSDPINILSEKVALQKVDSCIEKHDMQEINEIFDSDQLTETQKNEFLFNDFTNDNISAPIKVVQHTKRNVV